MSSTEYSSNAQWVKAVRQRDLKKLQSAPYSILAYLATLDFGPPLTRWYQKELRIREVAFVDNFQLLPHQLQSVDWMRAIERQTPLHGVKGGILSLEKGLGKTITALTLALSSPKGQFPTLVLCKKMFMWDTWKKEIEARLAGQPKVIYLHKDHLTQKEIDGLTLTKIRSADLVVTTYEFCMKVMKQYPQYEKELRVDPLQGSGPKTPRGRAETLTREKGNLDPSKKKGPQLIYEVAWERVICDESQNFSNDGSKIFRAVMGLVSDHRWCLSGSIVRNYDTDVLSQLRFLGYTSITSNSEWKKYGQAFFKSGGLASRIFQLGYHQVGLEMPAKEEEVVSVGLEGKFRVVYDAILNRLKESHSHSLKFCQLSLLTRIRQSLVSPFLLSGKSKRVKIEAAGATEVQIYLGQHLEKVLPNEVLKWCHDRKEAGWQAPKIKKTLEIIDYVIGLNQKVIVFSTQVMALDVIASALDALGISYRIIDGTVPTAERSQRLDRFRGSPKTHVLLASYKVCSESLNISEASFAILLDCWWNNATRDQAVARLWRMGQLRVVKVFSLFAKDTLDYRIEEVCRKKEILATKFRGERGGKVAKAGSVVGYLLK